MSQLLLPEQPKLITPDEAWAPLYWTKPKLPTNRGDDIIDFTATTMTASKGMRKGLPLELTEWQKFAVRSILEEDEQGFLRYKRFCVGIPRKNGKSMLGTALALERLLYGHEGTQIFSAAKDRDQAKIVFAEAKRQIAKTKVLSDNLKGYRDIIVNKKTGAFYKAASSDAMSFQGYGPEMVLCDEVHGWLPGQAEEFWAAINEGSGDLFEALIVAISTAGKNKESLWGRLVEHGIKVATGVEQDDSFGFLWWGAEDDADIFDEKVWKQANPNLAENLLSMKDMRDSITLAQSTGDLNQFKRYRLNQWVRTDGHDMYISPFHWGQAERPGTSIEKGSRIAVGFDGSVNEDSTAFLGIDIETGVMEILASWEKDPNNPEWAVDRDEVLAAQERIFAEYEVTKMWCDPAFFQTDVERWARRYRNKVERIPQSNTRMVPMTEQLKLDLISGFTVHNGDHALRKHFMNAVQDDNGKVMKERRGSKNKIDFVVCAILANGARNRILKRGKAPGRAITLG